MGRADTIYTGYDMIAIKPSSIVLNSHAKVKEMSYME